LPVTTAIEAVKCGIQTGPDFLDPMILERASGQPVYQLDLWMVGERDCKALLYQAAQEADLILIEGVMGLFDGTPSSADLAALFGVPVLALINAHAMAQTFRRRRSRAGALSSRSAVRRVLANRVAGPGHAELLAESLPPDLRYFGWLPRDGEIALPDRHLGLVQAAEIADLEARLESIAAVAHCDWTAELPPSVSFPEATVEPPARLLEGVRIGIARDTAFAFLYPANLDTAAGAGRGTGVLFAAGGCELPAVDSVYLPGGYPELHLIRWRYTSPCASLASASSSRQTALCRMRRLALYLESLADKEGNRAPMLGLLPGHAALQPSWQDWACRRWNCRRVNCAAILFIIPNWKRRCNRWRTVAASAMANRARRFIELGG
jgi:cobyrinic acid a,c-diamide synthase